MCSILIYIIRNITFDSIKWNKNCFYTKINSEINLNSVIGGAEILIQS